MSGSESRMGSRPLVLASASKARARLLENAGVAFETDPARIDETAVLDSLRAEEIGGRDAADILAELKASRVSERHAGALCVGSDQTLVAGGRIFSKPEGLAGARKQLRELRGGPHELHSAAVVAVDGRTVWRHVDAARLWMRDFSDDFLEAYLARAEGLSDTVGGYRLEDEGAQLFERVSGDWFTIMGMPLLPLLSFLREHGAAPR